jgi:AcrR family transcriptional regulator
MVATKRKTKGRARPALTRERILEAGLRLLAASPGAELSMRSLADELGTAPMSLYRHVRNREDLLEGINRLALESLKLEIPVGGGWEERALRWMHSLRRELHAHPAVAPLLRLRGSLAPTLLHVLDALLRVLLDAGFRGRGAALACREITWFTMSFVTNEIRNEARAETSSGAAGGDLSSFEHLSGEDLSNAPALAELLPSFAEIDVDEIFSVTAEHLLDGLGRSLKARQAERPQTRRASKR